MEQAEILVLFSLLPIPLRSSYKHFYPNSKSDNGVLDGASIVGKLPRLGRARSGWPPGGATYGVQPMGCNPWGTTYGVQPMGGNLWGATYGVQRATYGGQRA